VSCLEFTLSMRADVLSYTMNILVSLLQGGMPVTLNGAAALNGAANLNGAAAQNGPATLNGAATQNGSATSNGAAPSGRATESPAAPSHSSAVEHLERALHTPLGERPPPVGTTRPEIEEEHGKPDSSGYDGESADNGAAAGNRRREKEAESSSSSANGAVGLVESTNGVALEDEVGHASSGASAGVSGASLGVSEQGLLEGAEISENGSSLGGMPPEVSVNGESESERPGSSEGMSVHAKEEVPEKGLRQQFLDEYRRCLDEKR
jgi:hypothetical protein